MCIRDRYKEEVFSRMKRMVDYAVEQDVVLLHENEKEIYGDIASRCLELMEAFYGDHFKGVFDFANFVQCGQDTLEAYEMLKPYIFYIHIKDALQEDGEVVLPGDGDGNVKEILSMLDSTGYKGFLSLEPHLVSFDGLDKLCLLYTSWDLSIPIRPTGWRNPIIHGSTERRLCQELQRRFPGIKSRYFTGESVKNWECRILRKKTIRNCEACITARCV